MNPASGQVILEIVKACAVLVMRIVAQRLRRRFRPSDADFWEAGIDLAFALLAWFILWRPVTAETARGPTNYAATPSVLRSGVNFLFAILVAYLVFASMQAVLKHLSIDPAEVAIVVLTICVLIFFLLLTMY